VGDVVVLIDNPLRKVCGARKRAVCSGRWCRAACAGRMAVGYCMLSCGIWVSCLVVVRQPHGWLVACGCCLVRVRQLG
jgi:hypothetical protein